MLLEDLQVILKVAEFKSITAAATNLDMRTATASAAVKRVEHALGTELFIRTTRNLRISSAGEKYLPQCEKALLILDVAKQKMRDDQDIIDGDVRIALPSDLGRNLVTPWLDEFMTTHPNISVKSNISDSPIDFYRDSVDIALRYGSPDDANLYGFKICNVPKLLCASESYLNENGTPEHPHDLESHNGLFYQLYNVSHVNWQFTHKDEKFKIKMKGNRATNDGDIVRRWCVAGKGLAVKSCLDVADDVLNGNIVNIMPNYKPAPTELWLICPSRQLITPAIRLLRDTLKEKTNGILSQLVAQGIIEKSVLD